MDPVLNPYAPGAGTPPVELAGRDALLRTIRIASERIRGGRSAKSLVLVGMRGVGKTVLLDRMRQDAEAAGLYTIRIEASETRSLPAALAPQFRQVLLRLTRVDKAADQSRRALRALAGFAGSLKSKFPDLEVRTDFAAEAGLADNGDLQEDLQVMLETSGEAARSAGSALIVFIDEMQCLDENQLGALVTAMHRLAQQRIPVMMVGAGLPQLPGRIGQAKSYAERLFDFCPVKQLDAAAARDAIEFPAAQQGVEFDPQALDRLIEETRGYPYFLQEWCKQVWDAAPRSPVTVDDVAQVTAEATASLDENFYRLRFDRLNPIEKRYLRAMAELGAGPHRSSDVLQVLNRKLSALGLTRNVLKDCIAAEFQLISKGLVWSPAPGDMAFTVPMFDQFMKRLMPGDDWRGA
jgi:hypothetical protein